MAGAHFKSGCERIVQELDTAQGDSLDICGATLRSTNLPHCLEYAFETRERYEEAGAGKAVQLAGLEAVRRQPAVAMEDGETFQNGHYRANKK